MEVGHRRRRADCTTQDGRTHLAYKAEHVVDLESDLILAAEIRPADDGDAQTLVDRVLSGQANLQAAKSDAKIVEVVSDKGITRPRRLSWRRRFNFAPTFPSQNGRMIARDKTSRRDNSERWLRIGGGAA